MADIVTLEFHGLKEFTSDLKGVWDDYPQETKNFLKRQGTSFVRDVRDKMPAHWSKGKYAPKKAKNWDRDIQKDDGGSYKEVDIHCRAPHWGLLEHSHRMVLWGRPTNGFVQGFHYCENTRKEWETKLPKHVLEYIDKLLKKHKL